MHPEGVWRVVTQMAALLSVVRVLDGSTTRMASFVREVNTLTCTAAIYFANDDITVQKALVHFVADSWANPNILLPPAAARDLTLDVITASPLRAEDILQRIVNRFPIHSQARDAHVPWVSTILALLALYHISNGPIPALKEALRQLSPEECRRITDRLKESIWGLFCVWLLGCISFAVCIYLCSP